MRYLILLLVLPIMLLADDLFVGMDQYDQSYRFDSVPVPLLTTPPEIDGTIGAAEWAAASLLPPLTSRDPLLDEGVPLRDRTWIYLGYTQDALYVAWRQDLPPEQRPPAANATERDRGEGRDNTVNILFAPKPFSLRWNISGNPLGNLYDRHLTSGEQTRWNPAVTYQAHQFDTGWEGELMIPFSELDVAPPQAGERWAASFWSAQRKLGTILMSWPPVRWKKPHEQGILVFTGDETALRVEGPGQIEVLGDASLTSELLYRPVERGSIYYYASIIQALDSSQIAGGTYEPYDKIIGKELATFEPVEEIAEPGEYLLRYELEKNGERLAAGLVPQLVAPPLSVELTGYWLQAKRFAAAVRTERDDAATVTARLHPGGREQTAPIEARRAELWFHSADLTPGYYELHVSIANDAGTEIQQATIPFAKPVEPDWWTMREGYEPLIPEPFEPVQANTDRAEVLLRTYSFGEGALPSQIRTRGKEILARPMSLKTAGPWASTTRRLVEAREDTAIYETVQTAGEATLTTRIQVEFDGFMYVDLYLEGSGSLDTLTMEIPLAPEHSWLMQNYMDAPGPGATGKNRILGRVPEKGFQMSPQLTLWLGTPHYGLEFSCESSRGWAMKRPSQAMQLTNSATERLLTVRFVSQSIELDDEPRHIRFGLVATPTKTLLPHLQSMRHYDNYRSVLGAKYWAGRPGVWHPPVKDNAVILETGKWVQESLDRGQHVMPNGGWNISVEDPANEPFMYEMFAVPIQNASFSTHKQYAANWNSPFAQFMANSFGYNAHILRIQGIRFDTVVPAPECRSEILGNGWRDDDGNLWGSRPIFAQRECWKRLYRIFHGGRIAHGVINTPNACGPIMAVHSFSDLHEIGEGWYQHAKDLKSGYYPDGILAVTTGSPYGFRAEGNLKFGPLYWNERIGALLVNNSDPRFEGNNTWGGHYAAHKKPAIQIWEAWDWIDRWNSEFHGWWENQQTLAIDAPGDDMILGSYWLQPGEKALLIVTNFEQHPQDDLRVKLDLDALGLTGQLYAEDAVNALPVPITANGELRLDILKQRYRLLKVSREQPRFAEERLGENLIEPPAEPLGESWSSPEVELEPGVYILRAEIRIDREIGADSKKPNIMGRFSPAISHSISLNLAHPHKAGVLGTKTIADLDYPDNYYYHRFNPEYFTQTPGWLTIQLPVRITAKGPGSLALGLTDEGQAHFRNPSLKRVNE